MKFLKGKLYAPVAAAFLVTLLVSSSVFGGSSVLKPKAKKEKIKQNHGSYSVPEPGTLALLAGGLAALGILVSRKNKKK